VKPSSAEVTVFCTASGSKPDEAALTAESALSLHTAKHYIGYRTADCTSVLFKAVIIIIIIIIITAIEVSLGGSSPFTSTDKTNKNVHKRNNAKHSTNNTKE